MSKSKSPSEGIARFIVSHPWQTMALVFALLAVSLLQIHTLEIDSSTGGLIDEKDPKKAVYEEFKEVFGSDTLTVVVISPPQGDVFNSKTLTLIDDLTNRIGEFPGVTNVGSLTTARNIRGEDDFLNTDPLIDSIPEDPEELALLRERALANPTFVGFIVSEDARFGAINIHTDKGEDKRYERDFQDRLELAMSEVAGDHDLYQVGAPRYNVQFNRSVGQDQKTLLPASVLAIFLILTLSFRNRIAVVIPIVTGGLSIAMTLGFMAWMGYSVGVVSVMVPSILIVVGCTEDVHLIAEYLAEIAAGKDKKSAILATMQRSSLAITLTSLTTVLGFAALSWNDISAVREFGIICSFGLAANFVVTVIMVPGMLHILSAPVPQTQEKGNALSRAVDTFLELAIRVNRNHKPAMATAIFLLILVAVWGCLQLEVNNDPITYFKQQHPIRVDFSRLHQDMSGAQTFNVVFEVEEEGDIQEPEVLALVADLQDYLASSPLFDRSLSLADFVRLMHREMNNDPDFHRIPDSRGAVAEYLLLLDDENLFRYVDYERQRASLVVRHDLSGSAEVKRALGQVESWLEERVSGYAVDGESRTLSWAITGESILLHNATDAMIQGQVRSLALAIVAVFAIMSILFLSIKAGLVAALSNMMPILLNFGFMGLVGIPFNVATTMVGPLALGIAVDDTIHFMVRYQKSLRAKNDQDAAMEDAIRTEGRPIMTTSIALALGFSVLTVSEFVPSMYLGILAALVMIFALATDLFVNPVLLLSVQLITVWDYVALKISSPAMRKSLIFKNLSEREIKTVALLGSVDQGQKGDYLVRQGDPGEEMFLMLSGSADVLFDGGEGEEPRNLSTLSEGALFGEMALLGEGIRTSSVVARSDVELLKIDDKSLARCQRRNPRVAAKLFANISRVLIQRIKAADRKSN